MGFTNIRTRQGHYICPAGGCRSFAVPRLFSRWSCTSLFSGSMLLSGSIFSAKSSLLDITLPLSFFCPAILNKLGFGTIGLRSACDQPTIAVSLTLLRAVSSYEGLSFRLNHLGATLSHLGTGCASPDGSAGSSPGKLP